MQNDNVLSEQGEGIAARYCSVLGTHIVLARVFVITYQIFETDEPEESCLVARENVESLVEVTAQRDSEDLESSNLEAWHIWSH
jgi:hypothetical protein